MEYYSPPYIAKILKVNVSTVKRWVDKGLLESEKTAGGHRRIFALHLKKFLEGRKIIANQSYILKRLGKSKLSSAKPDWHNYYFYLYSNTSLSNKNILEELLLTGAPLLSIIENVVVPVLHRIGDSWQQGRLTIYDEHRMTFLLRSDLLRIDAMIPTVKNPKKTAVLACVKDENHEIPLMLLHLLLKQAGWKTIILGINTPAQEVAKAALANKAKLICLTKSYAKIDEQDYLTAIKRYLRGKKIKLALGGRGWKNYPSVKSFTEFKL